MNKHRKSLKGIIVLIFIITITTSYIVFASDNINGVKQELKIEEVHNKKDTIVYLEAYDMHNNFRASTTGVVITKDGQVVTNYNFIDRASKITAVTMDGKKFEIQGVLNYSKPKNIAILQLKGADKLPNVKLGDSDKVEVGNKVIGICSPYEKNVVFSSGNINKKAKSFIRDGNDLEIKASDNECGGVGAVFNMQRELIGITYGTADEYGKTYFAIPINEIKDFIGENKLKILSQVQQEVYPAIGYENLKKYIKDNYSKLNAWNQNITLQDVKIIQQDENSDDIYVLLNVDNNNYSKLMKGLQDKTYNHDYNLGIVENWIYYIGDEVAKRYPQKNISGGLFYIGDYKEKPLAFNDAEIDYNPDSGGWHVVHSITFFYNIKGNTQFVNM